MDRMMMILYNMMGIFYSSCIEKYASFEKGASFGKIYAACLSSYASLTY